MKTPFLYFWLTFIETILLDKLLGTIEVKDKILDFLMNKLEILLDLIDLKLVTTVSNRTIGVLIVMISAGIDGVVKKLVPIEKLVVLL